MEYPAVRSVTDVLDSLGIYYQLHGNEATACCPAHHESHPSWSVNIETGLHNCFACGFRGNLPALIRAVTGYDPDATVTWIRMTNVRAGHEKHGRQTYTVGPDMSWKYTPAALVLFQDPPVARLAERSLTIEACRAYGIRWDNNTGAWITPIRHAETDEFLGWQEKNDRCFRNRPRSVLKSEAVFGLGAVEHGGRAVLVESPLDAARLHAAGVGGGVSCFGVSVSDIQLTALLGRAGALVLALDNDLAGVRGTRALLDRVGRLGIRVFDYGDAAGKDPGELSDEQIEHGVGGALAPWRWYRSLRSAGPVVMGHTQR